jgi:hypothetical protein
VPADLWSADAPGGSAGGLGQELRAEADAEQGQPAPEQVPEQVLLGTQPGVRLLLVHVHGPAEDHRGVEPVERGRVGLGGRPLDELVSRGEGGLAEDAGAGVGLMDDREDPHPADAIDRARP